MEKRLGLGRTLGIDPKLQRELLTKFLKRDHSGLLPTIFLCREWFLEVSSITNNDNDVDEEDVLSIEDCVDDDKVYLEAMRVPNRGIDRARALLLLDRVFVHVQQRLQDVSSPLLEDTLKSALEDEKVDAGFEIKDGQLVSFKNWMNNSFGSLFEKWCKILS